MKSDLAAVLDAQESQKEKVRGPAKPVKTKLKPVRLAAHQRQVDEEDGEIIDDDWEEFVEEERVEAAKHRSNKRQSAEPAVGIRKKARKAEKIAGQRRARRNKSSSESEVSDREDGTGKQPSMVGGKKAEKQLSGGNENASSHPTWALLPADELHSERQNINRTILVRFFVRKNV